jgi:ferric-dicitrate binding protein FerR (iron transport regulator)
MKYEHFSASDFAGDGFFIRWVNGTDAEADWFWQSFMKEHPEKVPAIEEAKKIVGRFAFRKDELSTEAFDSMRNRFILSLQATMEKEKEDSFTDLTVNTRSKIFGTFWFKIAATLAVPLVCAAFYYILQTPSAMNNIFSREDTRTSAIEERTNPRGQKSVLQLADGTKVWLNADSRLSYAKDFTGKDQREVHLEGEAFFDVAHDASKPFLVHAAGITVKVLGTSFNVKSYGDDATVETTLVHGKVSINKEGDNPTDGNLVLEPNQKAIYRKETKTLSIEHVMAERSSSWRYDQLIFDEAPFADVIVRLERWYDVKIHVQEGDNLQCLLTADLGKESLEEVLNLLVVSQQIKYIQKGNEVFIQGTLCK